MKKTVYISTIKHLNIDDLERLHEILSEYNVDTIELKNGVYSKKKLLKADIYIAVNEHIYQDNFGDGVKFVFDKAQFKETALFIRNLDPTEHHRKHFFIFTENKFYRLKNQTHKRIIGFRGDWWGSLYGDLSVTNPFTEDNIEEFLELEKKI